MIRKTLLEGCRSHAKIFFGTTLLINLDFRFVYTALSIRQFFWSGQLSVFLQLQLSLPFAVGSVAVFLLDRIPMLCLDMTLLQLFIQL